MICFNITRDNRPVYESSLKDSIDINIGYSHEFLVIKSYLFCGGTLKDIKKIKDGTDDKEFTDYVIKIYLADNELKSHIDDIVENEKNRRMEEAKVKKSK